MFFDIPLNELYNQNVPLKFLIRQDANAMEAQLFEADSFHERTKVAESYLLMLLRKKKNACNFNRIEHSMHLINASKGMVSIDYLASEACFSRKQFERVFSQYIGATPKQFLKIIRFQHAIDLKSKNANANLADLTYGCGYYDQSHMTNEFQRLSGMTPKQYFDTCKPYSDYFQ
jgi:transcriptional regulator GlxA family with amidase domain